MVVGVKLGWRGRENQVAAELGEAPMATLKLRVTGMSCSHCQTRVEQALKTTAGVYSAIVDLQAGEAEIDFHDDSVTTQQLVAAGERALGRGCPLSGRPRRAEPGLSGPGPRRSTQTIRVTPPMPAGTAGG